MMQVMSCRSFGRQAMSGTNSELLLIGHKDYISLKVKYLKKIDSGMPFPYV